MLETTVVVIYTLPLLFILLYALMQLDLIRLYQRYRSKSLRRAAVTMSDGEFPFVTVQLPLYNERHVVERLLLSINALNYPPDRLEVQVLDDSDDDTTVIVENLLASGRLDASKFSLIRRPDRIGFKAGALRYGMESARGNFIAIFDADFMPNPNFLKDTLPHFKDAGTGLVQTRWGHVNGDYSLLTKLQVFGLDAHFTIEQGGRNEGHHFMNFNGTAGVWRRSCIEDAGGWQADTLTEDLDLSYRAQLKGWQFTYLEETVTPSEIPVLMTAYKSQQFRWTKGSAENMRKNLGQVLRAKLPLATKIHAGFHLSNSMVYVCLLATSLCSIPLIYVKHGNPALDGFFEVASLFLIGLLITGLFYFVSFAGFSKSKLLSGGKFVQRFVSYLSMTMGISLNNSIAAMEGLIGKRSPFVRTPKFNSIGEGKVSLDNLYLFTRIGLVTYLELVLSLYFCFGLYLAFYFHDFGLFFFHLCLAVGFGAVGIFTIMHSRLQ